MQAGTQDKQGAENPHAGLRCQTLQNLHIDVDNTLAEQHTLPGKSAANPPAQNNKTCS